MENRVTQLLIILFIFLSILTAALSIRNQFNADDLIQRKSSYELQISTLDRELQARAEEKEVLKSNKNSTACTSKLTTSEQATVGSWRTYRSTNGRYTFKYPVGWSVKEENSDSVILSEDAALFSFQFGNLDEDQLSGYKIESKDSIIVDCKKTEKTSLTGLSPGGENFRRVVIQVTKGGTTYTALITYRFVDSPTSESLVKNYDLILKTIAFK